MSNCKTAVCIHCGEQKPLDELNGTGIGTDHHPNAYCRWLAQCKSEHSQEIINELREAMEG